MQSALGGVPTRFASHPHTKASRRALRFPSLLPRAPRISSLISFRYSAIRVRWLLRIPCSHSIGCRVIVSPLCLPCFSSAAIRFESAETASRRLPTWVASHTESQMTATANHALQRTAPVGHAACSPQSPPRRHRARPFAVSELGVVSLREESIVNTTSKFPVRLSGTNSEKSTGDQLAPSLAASPEGFVSLKTGKIVPSGGVVYVGKPIDPHTILDRYRRVASVQISESDALARLEAFCTSMNSRLIGSLVDISYDDSALPVVQMLKRRFSQQPKSKLP